MNVNLPISGLPKTIKIPPVFHGVARQTPQITKIRSRSTVDKYLFFKVFHKSLKSLQKKIVKICEDQIRCNPLKSLGDQKQTQIVQKWSDAANPLKSLGNLITFFAWIFVHWPKKSLMISRS